MGLRRKKLTRDQEDLAYFGKKQQLRVSQGRGFPLATKALTIILCIYLEELWNCFDCWIDLYFGRFIIPVPRVYVVERVALTMVLS